MARAFPPESILLNEGPSLAVDVLKLCESIASVHSHHQILINASSGYYCMQQGREHEESSARSATFKASDQIGTASTKQTRVGHKAPPPPGVPVSEIAHQQHGASSSSADAPPRSRTDSEGSYSVSTGAIPFSIQPVQLQQSSIESSNSAAMLQRPPAPRQPLFREIEPGPLQAESLAEPSRASAEKPCERHAAVGKPGPSTEANSAAQQYDSIMSMSMMTAPWRRFCCTLTQNQ